MRITTEQVLDLLAKKGIEAEVLEPTDPSWAPMIFTPRCFLWVTEDYVALERMRERHEIYDLDELALIIGGMAPMDPHEEAA